MATATLTLSGTPNAITEGSTWTLTISNITGTDLVNDTTKYTSSIISATSPNLGNLFTIDTTSSASNNKVNGYSGSGVQYVTFRSIIPAGGPPAPQHPTTGFSLDLWSSSLYTAIITNSNTWTDLNGTTHNLSSDKYSLVYSYTSSYPPIFSKGGTLTISVA